LEFRYQFEGSYRCNIPPCKTDRFLKAFWPAVGLHYRRILCFTHPELEEPVPLTPTSSLENNVDVSIEHSRHIIKDRGKVRTEV